MGSLCRGILLKFLCTSLVWGWWVTLGPLWWHHVVVEAFPLGLLADPCLRDRTPSLHPHAAHILANTYLLLSIGNFSKGLWSIHSCSLNTLTLFSRLLYISHGGLQAAVTFWMLCMSGILEPPVIFSYETLTQAVFFPYFCCVPPPSLVSKSGLEPVKGLMRLVFIRQWVGTVPDVLLLLTTDSHSDEIQHSFSEATCVSAPLLVTTVFLYQLRSVPG